MIGILLFFYALRRYTLCKDRVAFYLILQFFTFNAYNLLGWDFSVLRFNDYAILMILYTVLMSWGTKCIPRQFLNMTSLYFALIILCVVVSLVVYKLPPLQVAKGGRMSLYALVAFDMAKMKQQEFKRLFHQMFRLSVVACFVYVVVVLFRLRFMGGFAGTGFLGLGRSYAYPPLIALCCAYSVYRYSRRNLVNVLVTALVFVTLIIIQSRGMLLSVVFALGLGAMLQRKKSNVFLVLSFVFFIGLYVVNGLVFEGDTGEKTLNDFSAVWSGDAMSENYDVEAESTFSYRINILFLAVQELLKSPLSVLFGQGLFVAMPVDYIVERDLTQIAIMNRDGYALTSPDISYFNIVNNLGLLGTAIYMIYIFFLGKALFRAARIRGEKYTIIGVVVIVHSVIIAFDGSSMTWPDGLLLSIMFYLYSFGQKDESHPHRVRLR